MGFRVGFYVLILAVGLLGAMGLGVLDQGGKRSSGQAAVVAAPLADNGADNSSDNSSDNFVDNSVDNGGGPPTQTPTATTTPVPGQPQPQPQPQPSGPCQFVLGFQFLHQQLNGTDGNCVDNEHNDPNGTGDRVQGTAKTGVPGYMVYQLSTNTMRWTDGFRTFTYSSCGLQERLNTQSWIWERNPSMVVGGVVPPGGCELAS